MLILPQIRKKKAAAGGAFFPSDVFTGQNGWFLNVQDLTTMYPTIDGTGPNSAVGDYVASMDDVSGNGLLFAAQSTTNAPILRQDGSGYYYLERVETTQEGLRSTTSFATLSATTGFGSIYAVKTPSVLSGESYFVDTDGGTTPRVAQNVRIKDNELNSITVGGGVKQATHGTTILTNTDYLMMGLLYKDGADELNTRLDGVDGTATSMTGATPLEDTKAMGFGTDMNNQYRGKDHFCYGGLHRVGCFDDDEIADLETWFKANTPVSF